MSEQPYTSQGEMPVCDTPRRPWLLGVNIETKRAVAFKPRCKLWTCPACAEINRRLWGARAYFGAEVFQEAGDNVYFLTLTSHEGLSPEGTIKVWPQAWKTLRQRAVRWNGGQVFDYLMVPEKHKNGRLHVHMVETLGAGDRWWKDNARQCGLGYMVSEQVCNTANGAAFYVTKYIGKSLGAEDWPANFRRVRLSRSWPPLPEMETAPGWHWRVIDPDNSLDDELTRIQESGFALHTLDHYTAWVYARAVSRDGEVDT